MKQKIGTIVLLFGVILILSGCSKTDIQTPTVSTVDVTSITEMTAVAGGIISTDNGSIITARGVCWSTSPNPTIADNKIESSADSPDSYTCNLTGLNPITTYYVRAYATNAGGTAYGEQVSFSTKAFELTTIPPTFITATTAISGGLVSFDNDRPDATSRGVCWNELPNPTTSDNITLDGVGKGSFTSTITELKPYTTYYVRAYITNSEGTRYGNEQNFTTQNGVIGIVTDAVSSITSTSATYSATISGDGGATITERGFCWSKLANPTNTDSKVVVGNGTGSYTKEISGLVANTTYFVRSYSTNSFGTVYGNEQSFTTLVGVPKACFESSSIVGLKATFSNCSDYPTTCLWDFGDGKTSTENAPTHVYNSAGTYNVKLVVSNDGLSDFTIKSVVISDIVDLNEIKVPVNTYPYIPTSIDVDFDGIIDFQFYTQYMSSPISGSYHYSSSIGALNNYELFCDSIIVTIRHNDVTPNTTTLEKVDIPKIYVYGNTISNSVSAKMGGLLISSYNASWYGTYYNNDIWIKDEVRYIGFRKMINGITKIGWIKLKVLNYYEVTLYGYKIPTEGESLLISK